MHVPSAVRREADVALLTGLTADSPESVPVLLDGRQPAYLVSHGGADLYAIRRTGFPQPLIAGTVLTRIEQGCVLPSSTVLGAWQLVLAPLPGTRIRPLRTHRLRQLGLGGPADCDGPADPLVPPPRAVSVLAAALARGLDAGLLAIADALRVGCPPGDAVPLCDTELVSLAAGCALAGDGQVAWLRVAGGHIRRNGDQAAVFGGPEPALLAGRDWIVADGPCTVESVRTAALLVAGQLSAAIDHHTVLTLRTIEQMLVGGEPLGSPPTWPSPQCPPWRGRR
ncbi:MAG TPA: hypothetical protein VEO01_17955 [Pseudonocardiaceae bacterium]|nr:hypothetical protein [Pseudonocardiaceae bacterium]